MPFSTADVLAHLRRKFPRRAVTEDRLRMLIRRGRIPTPHLFAGRYAWSDDDIRALEDHLRAPQGPADETDGAKSAQTEGALA